MEVSVLSANFWGVKNLQNRRKYYCIMLIIRQIKKCKKIKSYTFYKSVCISGLSFRGIERNVQVFSPQSLV